MVEVILADDPAALGRALEVLAQGGVLAFPTDTVYGLGAMALDPAAVDRLFLVKGREREKAIPVLIGADSDWPLVAASVPESASRLAERFWPGPLTLIVPRRTDLPSSLGPLPTVGVRIPDHSFARELLRSAGPLAVTSANLSGGAEPLSAEAVRETLGPRLELIIDGGITRGGVASTVVDCTTEPARRLRAGPIRLEDLRAIVAIEVS